MVVEAQLPSVPKSSGIPGSLFLVDIMAGKAIAGSKASLTGTLCGECVAYAIYRVTATVNIPQVTMSVNH